MAGWSSASPSAGTPSASQTLPKCLAIGGETTGWVLCHGDKQRVQVLLPVEAFAWIRDGVYVAVTGVYGTRRYPERGEVVVFIVKKISQVVH